MKIKKKKENDEIILKLKTKEFEKNVMDNLLKSKNNEIFKQKLKLIKNNEKLKLTS